MGLTIITTLSQLILAFAVPYFVISLVLGVRTARREGGHLGFQEVVEIGDYFALPSEYELFVLVPCLNEQEVVGPTVARLLADPACTVIVIDDGSDDATGFRAYAAAREIDAAHRLLIHRRQLPDARQGKGPALNAGFVEVRDEVARRGLDPERVIIGVMDADGRLSRGGTRVSLRPFADPEVGGVQLAVRIRNRRQLIGRFQDVEFWMISALSQFGRSVTGTVSLGGNGQFTRLSALNTLDGDPWTTSLTEDLDLGLRLITEGWRITTVTKAYVDQQGVDTYRRLVRQRTRWYQGHMTAGGRLRELWRSPNVRTGSLMEVTCYLLVPWLIVLPWSLLQQWVFYELIFGSGQGVVATELGSVPERVAYFALWYVLSFLPNVLIGITYARRTKDVSLAYALLLGHLMLVWNYIGYFATWRALVRMAQGRDGWDKTTRTVEPVGAVSSA